MTNSGRLFLFFVLPVFFISGPVLAFTVSVTSSLPSPQRIGLPVTLQAAVQGADAAADIVYQFSVTPPGQQRGVVQGFRDKATFAWAAVDDGSYVLTVIARDRGTQEVAVAHLPFLRVAPPAPVVLPTAHPQVLLVSLPACPPGAQAMRVIFQPANLPGPIDATHFKPCRPGLGVAHYVGGLVGNTGFTLTPQFAAGGSLVSGQPLAGTTGSAPAIRDWAVIAPPGPASSLAQNVMLASPLDREDHAWALATNLAGQPVWSYHNQDVQRMLLTRPVPGGTFLMTQTPVDGVAGELLVEVDLAGNVVRETNMHEMRDQLTALGEDPMGGFHHEALRLPNGHTLVLASVERFVTDLQGPGEVHVYGEMVLDLDPDWDIAWVWNSFDHIDLSRVALLGETCTNDVENSVPQGGCPWLELGDGPANDWLHMNAIGYSPVDGNFVLSARHLDAVFKVNYADGAGTGEVVWELGEGGDFTLLNAGGHGPWPWFTHQHDTRYQAGEFVVYDNGNTRHETLGTGENSRCQSFVLDEQAMTAELVANADLGHYAAAVGAAQRLDNGTYHCGTGWLGTFTNPASSSLSMTVDGTFTWGQVGLGRWYRSVRMNSLYAQ